MLTYKVTSLPDLTLSRYQAFADTGVEGMLDAQTQFIRQLNRVLLLGKTSAHFYYIYNPEKESGEKLDIYISFSDTSEQIQSKLRKVIDASGIKNYFKLDECDDSVLSTQNYSTMSCLSKKERFLQTSLNNEERFFYVVPNWELNDEARLYSIYKLMESFDFPCCYRVDLYTETELEDQIHDSFARPLTYLRNISAKKAGISELSKIQNEQRDPSADETLRQYEDWIKAVDTSTVFLCRICVLSDDRDIGQLLLDSALTESIKTGNCKITPKQGTYSIFSEIENYDIICDPETPNSLRKWSITYTAEQIAAFVRLPVLYDGENIELRKETAALQAKEGMLIGHAPGEDGDPVKISFDKLPKHMFVCGVPGSGKTTTMLRIANSLWNDTYIDEKSGQEVKRNIPFLVLEPAKREYRELSGFDIPELLIFSPSACTNFPLKINPFEFPIGLTLSEHINRLCQVFEGAFPIAPPAPFILDRAIQKIYENHQWNSRDINNGTKEYPTMSELYAQFEKELQTTSYDSEIQGNIRSVLEMRIGSLLRREMKDMFDVKKSSLLPEEWLKKPVIIELEALGEGPANFVTLLLCTLIRETLKVNPNQDKEKPLRHVIFIEEAHNLISPKTEVDDPQDSNPKIAATSYIVKMLAEVRALREGIIIADQLPTAMAPEVIKNTNIKLVHRLTSSDDRELVGSTMSASSLQLESMATYSKGQALMIYEDLLRPFQIKVANVSQHGDAPDDTQLLLNMKKKPGYIALRQKEEFEKFDEIKKTASKLCSFEEKGLNSIKNTHIPLMTEADWERFFETHTRNIRNIAAMRIQLLHESSMISREYFSEERRNNLTKAIEDIGKAYEKEIQRMAARCYKSQM